MSDKEKDKRLLIPRDKFEEEASEGLGRLNREEAKEDLLELRSRMERRLRKPRMIWLPAAAAVVILLVASTVYIALFRERIKRDAEIALMQEPITDTVLIAMAQPIQKTGSGSLSHEAMTERARLSQKSGAGAINAGTGDRPAEAGTARGVIAEDKDEISAIPEAAQVAVESAAEEEMVAVAEEVSEGVSEVVVVEAMPQMEKAAVNEKIEKAAEEEKMGKAAVNDKKEKAPATNTVEDSAMAAPGRSAGVPDRQAAPVGGMEDFNIWIRKNIRYPEEIVPRAEQAVIVTFKISADSTLYDLTAEQTAGEPFTREAFRLLREGPKWVPAVRNGKVSEEAVRVSIVFR